MSGKALVVDANILVRAVLGKRIREIIERYAEDTSFFVRDLAFAEAEEHLPALVRRRGGDPRKALALVHAVAELVEILGNDIYGSFEAVARQRLNRRDPDDWPVLAAALALGCPIWTEDADFFGCGVATWTSNIVEEFLRES